MFYWIHELQEQIAKFDKVIFNVVSKLVAYITTTHETIKNEM